MPAIKRLFAPSVIGERPVDGLILNSRKCQHTPVSDLLDSDTGLRFMGSCIWNGPARSAFLSEKIESLRPALHRLKQLPHQIGLSLLRQCFATQLRHLLRSDCDIADDCSGWVSFLNNGTLKKLSEKYKNVFSNTPQPSRGADGCKSVMADGPNRFTILLCL
jgi:hypothetical protein